MSASAPIDADHTIATDALRALAVEGVLTFADLAERLGLDDADVRFDRIVDELLDGGDRVQVVSGDRIADAVALLATVTLTRRVTAEELAAGELEVDPDLTPLSILAGDSLPLADGGRVTVESSMTALGVPTASLRGPSGWLDDLAVGDLLGVRLHDGRLHIGRVPEPAFAPSLLSAFAAGTDAALDLVDLDGDARAELSDVLWETLAADRDGLAGTLPPLSELLDAAGCNRRGVMVARTDVVWPPHDPATLAKRLAEMLHGLSEASAEALQAMRVARAAALEGPVDGAVAADVAWAFRDADAVGTLLEDWPTDPATTAVAEAVAAAVEAVPAGASVVLADAAERAGDIAGAERHLHAALTVDGAFEPALIRAAAVAEDRGDARRALNLLRRAGLSDDEGTLPRLRAALAPSPSARRVGRNDPCPCGSGRKFKRCCADGGTRPLRERADWLVYKIVRFVGQPEHLDLLRPVGLARIPDQGPGWGDDVRVDPLVVDLAVFDLGLLDSFLARRGALLPADERELAERWRDSRRSVYRVVGHHGDQLTLQDLRAGTTVTAWAFGAPPQQRDAYLLARVVPAGADEQMVFWAATALGPILPAAVDVLCDTGGDPVDIAGRLQVGRPRLRTTEDEPIVHCELRCALPPALSAAAAAAVLDGVDALRSEGDGRFVEVVPVAGMDRIRGTVTVDGHEVRIDANAVERAERLLELVRAAVPGLDVVVDRRTPIWQAMEDQQRFGVPPVPHEPSADERAALDELVRRQEQRWIDEPVPALGGLTPRQARGDPEHLPDLVRLLDEPAGMFDADRLRSLLDL